MKGGGKIKGEKDKIEEIKESNRRHSDIMRKTDTIILVVLVAGILIGIGATPLIQDYLKLALNNIAGIIGIIIGLGILVWIKSK